MRSLSILAVGLSVLISSTSAQGGKPEVFGYCDDNGDGSCSPPEKNAMDLAEEMKEEAVYKAHAILRALHYDPNMAHVEDEGSDEDNYGRGGRFLMMGGGNGGGMMGGFGHSAIKAALAMLSIFDVNFNANMYVEKAGVGAGAGIELGTTSPPRRPHTTPAPHIYLPSPPPPPGCNCTQSNYEPCRGGDGICSSASECEGMGGESIGKCANCLGCSVCCRYTSGCQGMTDKMITYFQSPAYPRTDRSNEVCSLTLNVRDEVCQVRLDLIDFEMAAPVCGDCSVVDNLEIINTAQPGGVLGPGQSRLCGLNSGQHMYLPVKPNNMLILKATTSGVRNVPLAATDGRDRGLSGDTAFRWNVRVTQIPCRPNGEAGGMGGGVMKTMEMAVGGGNVAMSANAVGFGGKGACKCNIPKLYKQLRAPWGCRQYFDENRGELKSFNFDARSEVSTGLDYSICVKRDNDVCGMTLNALTFSLPASPWCLSGEESIDCYGGMVNESAMVQARGKMTVCCTGSKDNALPGVNYFGFGGFTDGQTMRTLRGSAYDPNQNRYFYCGAQLGNGSLVVGRTKGPLIMRVVTSEDYWGQCCLGGVCSPAEREEYSRKRRAIAPPPVYTPEPTPAPHYPGEPAPSPYHPTPSPHYPSSHVLPEAYCPEGGCQGFLIKYDVNSGSC